MLNSLYIKTFDTEYEPIWAMLNSLYKKTNDIEYKPIWLCNYPIWSEDRDITLIISSLDSYINHRKSRSSVVKDIMYFNLLTSN